MRLYFGCGFVSIQQFILSRDLRGALETVISAPISKSAKK